jgi:hypothetical protein
MCPPKTNSGYQSIQLKNNKYKKVIEKAVAKRFYIISILIIGDKMENY